MILGSVIRGLNLPGVHSESKTMIKLWLTKLTFKLSRNSESRIFETSDSSITTRNLNSVQQKSLPPTTIFNASSYSVVVARVDW